jgi:ABC-type transporter Mla subunit MlaD
MPGAEGLPDGVASTLLDRGVLGACVLVLGALAWWLIRREAARADEAQRQVTALHDSIRTDVVAALIKANDVLAKVADTLPDVASALRDHDRDRDKGRR